MRKTFHILLGLLMTAGSLPLNAFAMETTSIPPVYVRTVYLNRTINNTDISSLERDVITQERSNRDQESLIKELARGNAALVAKIEELRRSMDDQNQSDLNASTITIKQLKEVIESYKSQITDRDRAMMARNEETIELRSRIEKLTAQYNEALKAGNDSAELAKQQGELVLEWQSKYKILTEKYQELLNFKQQLLNTQQELQDLNQRYLDLMAKDKDKDRTIEMLQKENGELKETISTLKSQIDSLQQKDVTISQLQDQILKKDEEIAQLKSQLAKTQQELDQVKEDLSAKDKTISSQQVTIDSLNKDVSQMTLTITDLKKTYAGYDEGFERIRANIILLKNKLAAAQARIGEYENQAAILERLKADIADLTNQVATGRQDLSVFKSKITTLNATIDDLNNQLQSKDRDLQNKDSQIGQLKSDVQKAQVTIDDLTAQVRSLTDQVSTLKTSLAELSDVKERLRLSEELVAKQRASEDLAAEKVRMLTQLAQSNQDKADYYRDQLKKTILYWQELNQKDQDQLEGLRKELSDKQAQLDSLMQQLEASKKQKAELESMIEGYQRTSDEKDATIKKQNQEINSLKADLQTANDAIDQREKDLKKVKDYFFELEKSASAKALELRDKNQQIALLKAALDQKDRDLSNLTSMLTLIQTKYKSSLTTIDSQAANIQELQKKQSAYELDIATLKEKVAAAEEQLRNMVDKNEITKQQAIIDDLTRQLNDALAKNTASLNVISLQEAKYQDLLNKFNAAQDDLASLKNKLADAQAQLQDSVNKSELEKLNAMIAQLTSDLKASQDKNKESLDVISLQESKYQSLLKQQNAYELDIAALKDKLAIAEDQIKNMVDKNQVEKQQAIIDDLTRQLNDALAKNKDSLNVISLQEIKYQTILAKFNASEQELSDLKSKIATYEYQLNNMVDKSQLDKLNAIIDELNQKLTAALERNKASLNVISAQEAKYQQALKQQKAYELEISSLKNQLAAAQDQLRNSIDKAQVEKLKRVIDDLTKQLAAAQEKNRVSLGVLTTQEAKYQDALKQQKADAQALAALRVQLAALQQKLNASEEQRLRDKQRYEQDLENAKLSVPDQVALLAANLEKEKFNSLAVKSVSYREADYQILLKKDKALEDEKTSMQQDLRALKAKLSATETNFRGSSESSVVNEQRKQILQLNAQVKQLQDQLKNSVSANQFDLQKKDLATLNERLVVAEEKLRSTDGNKGNIEKSQQAVAVSSNEVAQLKEYMKEKDVQIAALMQQNGGNAGLQEELAKSKSRITKFMEELYAKDKEIERLKMQLSKNDQTIKPLTEPLSAQALTYEPASTQKIKMALEDAQKQISVLKSELKDKEAAINQLQSVKIPAEDLKDQLKKAKKEVADVKAAALDKSNQAESLSAQISALNEKIQKLQDKVKSLKGNPNDI
ncbi:MAG: hypothetical protein HQL15_04890 [Candidatus Omnitrophica bacterium]|nr:hypothetical protein [Candidatus Omnitrophota bacterium]